MAITMTRQEMEQTLRVTFSPEQTSSLVEVLDMIRQVELQRAADTRDLKRGLTELTAEVKNLAVAQQRSDERLAKFEMRTDERLAKFEMRTDERFAELAAAQQRTDHSVAQLGRSVESLGKIVQDLVKGMDHVADK